MSKGKVEKPVPAAIPEKEEPKKAGEPEPCVTVDVGRINPANGVATV